MRFTYVLRRAAAAALLIGLVMGNAPLPAAAHGAQVKITDDSTGRTYTPQYSDVTVNADNSLSFDGYTVKNGTITYSDGAFNAFYNYQRIPIDRNNPAFRANASSLHVNSYVAPAPAATRAPATPAPLASASSDTGGGHIVSAGGGNLISQDGGGIVSAGGGNLISQDGSGIVAAGGGNYTVMSFEGNSKVPPAANQCADARISLAYISLLKSTGDPHYNLGAGDHGRVGRCDPTFYAGADYTSATIQGIVAHTYTCSDAPDVSQALFLEGFTPQTFGGCDPTKYYDHGKKWTRFTDLLGMMSAYAHNYSVGRTNVTFDASGCLTPGVPVAYYPAQNLFFENYGSVANLNFATAKFGCSNFLPPGLYRGDPNNVPVALQLRPATPAPAATIAAAGPSGCVAPNVPAAVFSKAQLFFANYASVANLDLSQASAFTCTNTLPNGLYRGDPANIPVALQLHPAAPAVTPAPVAVARDQYGCTTADPAVGVFTFNGYTEYDPIAYPNLDLTQATRILCRSAIPSPGYANPNIPQTRFMKPTQTSPYAGIVTSQTGGTASAGYIGVDDGIVFTTSPADLNNVGLTLSLPQYSTHIYPDGLRHDIVAGSRLQGYTTKANLLAQRVGDLNPTCDQVVFVMKGYRYSTHVAVANRTDALAYQCANDLLSFGKVYGISYTFVP